MNGLIKRAGRFFVDLVPSESPILYRACKRYVDRYNGENNSDIRTNGELRFMQRVLSTQGRRVLKRFGFGLTPRR